MRTHLSDFDMVTPTSLEKALKYMNTDPPPIPFAGGTDLMVLQNDGTLKPGKYMNISSIPEMTGRISYSEGILHLTGMVTYTDVRRNPDVRRFYPILPLASREIGAVQIQNRGTWAGNIVNASPAADGVPALIAYDAEVELMSVDGPRNVFLADFYSGYKVMDKKPNELVTAINIPVPGEKEIHYFRKVGTRRFQAISKTLLAGRLMLGNENKIELVRLVFASVMPYTYRAIQTEKILSGNNLSEKLIEDAVSSLKEEIKPIDDIRSNNKYRLNVSCNLLRDFLKKGLSLDK